VTEFNRDFVEAELDWLLYKVASLKAAA